MGYHHLLLLLLVNFIYYKIHAHFHFCLFASHRLSHNRLMSLACLRPAEQEDPTHFTANGFSAGSYTGAVIALAIRCLWPASQITARLGAIAMPKSVLAALVATAEPEAQLLSCPCCRRLCDWKPTDNELDMLQRSLHITYVEDSARWMGKHKHCCWHWLQCQLPTGKVSLTTLKLTHPAVVPRRDRIAAPMRLASWIRFETGMTSDDWEGAISLLVSNLHRPDQELLMLLQSCVAGQQIASMEEAQALLLQKLSGRQRQSKCVCPMAEGDGSRPLSTDPVPGSVCHSSPISPAAHLLSKKPPQDKNYGVVPLFESLASSWISHQQLPGCRACMNRQKG